MTNTIRQAPSTRAPTRHFHFICRESESDFYITPSSGHFISFTSIALSLLPQHLVNICPTSRQAVLWLLTGLCVCFSLKEHPHGYGQRLMVSQSIGCIDHWSKKVIFTIQDGQKEPSFFCVQESHCSPARSPVLPLILLKLVTDQRACIVHFFMQSTWYQILTV